MADAIANTLFVVRHGPYGRRSGRDAIEALLAFAAFERPVAVLFLGEGIWQLLANQDSSAIGQKSQSKLLSALPIYDVNTVYVCSHSMKVRHISSKQLCIPVESVDQTQIVQLMAKYKHLLSF